MHRRKISIFINILVLAAGIQTNTTAQVLHDTATINLMKQGVDYIYNLQFDKATAVYYQIRKKYPEHPMTYIYKGMLTYWKDYPLIATSPSRGDFEKDMMKAIELCDEKQSDNMDAEYVLASIGARGLLLLYYADNDLSMEVFKVASGTYFYVKKSFELTGTYPDFYFVTGLYNYYREAYPEAHPVYKALAMLFPRGNMKQGLSELQIAAKEAIMLKAEAYTFLSGICISFENDFYKAYSYSKLLHELYPGNFQYLANYIKNLILIHRYDEAERLIKSSRTKISNAFFNAQLTIYSGIIYEKKYKDFKTATSYYTKGIRDMKSFGVFGDEFTAYSYFGLSRISAVNGDKQNIKSFRKKAEELTDYENVNFDR